VTIASSLAKEIEDFSTVGTNRAYSNERGRKNECSNGMFEPADKIYALTRSMGYQYR